MPFSIDQLSVAAEAQKIILSANSEVNSCEELTKPDSKIYITDGLTTQDPIIIF